MSPSKDYQLLPAAIVLCIAAISTAPGMIMGVSGILVFLISLTLPLSISISIIALLAGIIPQSATVDKVFLVFEKLSFCEISFAGIFIRYIGELCLTVKDEHPFAFNRNTIYALLFAVLLFAFGLAKNASADVIADIRPILLYLLIFPAMYAAGKDFHSTLRWLNLTLIAAGLFISVELIAAASLKSIIPYDLMPDLHDDNRVSLRNGGFLIFSFGVTLQKISENKDNIIIQAAYIFAAMFFFFGSTLTQNRTIVAAFVFQIIAFQLIGKKLTLKLIFKISGTIILVLVALYGLVAAFPDSIISDVFKRFELALHPEENVDTLLARTSMIAAAWDKFIASPLFGIGLGAKFEIVLFEYSMGDNLYIDNLWVVLLCKFGVIGFGILLYALYKKLLRQPFSRNDSITDKVEFISARNIFTASMAGELAMSFTTAMLWSHVASIVPFSILTGILIRTTPSPAILQRDHN
jgi:hypothetical protein